MSANLTVQSGRGRPFNVIHGLVPWTRSGNIPMNKSRELGFRAATDPRDEPVDDVEGMCGRLFCLNLALMGMSRPLASWLGPSADASG